jgi:hypothetical protein
MAARIFVTPAARPNVGWRRHRHPQETSPLSGWPWPGDYTSATSGLRLRSRDMPRLGIDRSQIRRSRCPTLALRDRGQEHGGAAAPGVGSRVSNSRPPTGESCDVRGGRRSCRQWLAVARIAVADQDSTSATPGRRASATGVLGASSPSAAVSRRRQTASLVPGAAHGRPVHWPHGTGLRPLADQIRADHPGWPRARRDLVVGVPCVASLTASRDETSRRAEGPSGAGDGAPEARPRLTVKWRPRAQPRGIPGEDDARWAREATTHRRATATTRARARPTPHEMRRTHRTGR